MHLASTKLRTHCKCFRCTTNPATIVNEPPEIGVTNLDDIAEELVQTAEESDRLIREEQDVLDEDLSTPSPNPALLQIFTLKTKVPPKFRYPGVLAEGLNCYWKWNIKHLEEMLVAELMTESLEDVPVVE